MRRMSMPIVLIILLVPLAVSANERRLSDGNDTRGPLDIKRMSHGHAGDGKLWHKVVMHGRWGVRDLRGTDEIRFHITKDREDRFDEVHASVAVKDGELRAWIFPYTEGSDYAAVGPSTRIRLVRPDARSVKIVFDESWVQNRRDRYAWSVGSDYRDRDSAHCRRSCFDYAPGSNPDRLVHDL